MSSSSEMRPARLHPTTEAVYRYIIRFKRMHDGDSPTRRQIGAGVGIPTTSVVNHHLQMLERTGRIALAKPRGQARMIRVTGAEWRFDELQTGENKCTSLALGGEAELQKEEVKVG